MSDIATKFGRMKSMSFAAGDTLIREGQEGGRILVLETGELGVLRSGVEIATISDRGAIVGEVAALIGGPASATVVAKGPVKARVASHGLEALENNPALLLHVARLLARRLQATTASLVETRLHPVAPDDLLFLEQVFTILRPEDNAG